MIIGLCICAFLAGFTTGDYLGECRWKQLALDALDVAETAIGKLRGSKRAGQHS